MLLEKKLKIRFELFDEEINRSGAIGWIKLAVEKLLT
jgi:hypothetical protein